MSLIKLAFRGQQLRKFLKSSLNIGSPSTLDEKFGYKIAKNAIRELNEIKGRGQDFLKSIPKRKKDKIKLTWGNK